ncbi:MAG: BON domain-containing protein [Methylococcaceae bacterium]|nr:BON domain-containing protein [Methylococcaceae bacterium]
MKTKPQILFFRYVFAIAVAGCIAMGINGCAGTKIKESTGQYIDDAAITTKVNAKLVEDPVVSALRINVETYKGVVQLSGFANSRAEIEQAETLAKQTEGVRDVRNDIHLKK